MSVLVTVFDQVARIILASYLSVFEITPEWLSSMSVLGK